MVRRRTRKAVGNLLDTLPSRTREEGREMLREFQRGVDIMDKRKRKRR